MKKIYFTFCILMISLNSNAQNKNTETADKFFETYQYINAIDEYLILANSKNANQYVYNQLANCYYNIYNPEEAAKWFEKAVASSSDAETYYKYAQTLKSLGKYSEANKQMDVFAKLLPNDFRAKFHIANPNYITSLANKSKLFDVAQTSIKNSGQSDFGAFLSDDNILYFTSNRNKSSKIDKWTNQPYLDVFKVVKNSDGTLSEPMAVSELNSPYHDGPVTISADGNTMYFARDGHSDGKFEKNKKANLKVGRQGIYKATKINGKWSNIKALPINNTSFSFSNPSLSKDGKTLYFASNMEGGFGESDIWKISINQENYGTPENLGPKINTKGKENFPFISDDNILYFSTSERQGFGGLDVYKADLNTDDEPINIGKSVNTQYDDFSFFFNSKENIGYFSSNRNGSDAIFQATPICIAEALVVVSDTKSNKFLSNANVSVLDSKGSIIATKQSNNLGEISFDIECNTPYTFYIKAQNFEDGNFNLKKSKSGKNKIDALLVPTEVIITDKEVILKNVYFDFNKSDITAQGANELDKLVKVMQDNPSMIIFVKSHTDSKGSLSYNLKLSEQRAQSTVQYLVSKGISRERISGKGFGSSEPKINCTNNCSEEQHSENRRSEFLIQKK